MSAGTNATIVEAPKPTAGMYSSANRYALDLAEHCYRAANQTEGSEARIANERKAILDLEEVAKRLGFDIVPARSRHGA